MMAMSRLSLIAALLGCGSAQTVCRDDANFLEDKPFVTGFAGSDGTCGSWRDTYIVPFLRDTSGWTVASCMAKVDAKWESVPGSYSMPAMGLMMFMAKPGTGNEGAGCCGDSEDGSACDIFMDDLPDEPCSSNYTEEDGKCMPCYGRVVARDCRGCWGIDPGGCSRDECTSDLGVWSENSGECVGCSSLYLWGCSTEDQCAGAGGKWDSWDAACRSCRPEMGDIAGCDQEECESVDVGGSWREFLQDGRTRGMCMLCNPRFGRTEGCDEAGCLEAANMGFNWRCHGVRPEDCYCSLCEFNDGNHRGCNEDRCLPTNEAPDVMWKEQYGSGSCVRCYKEANGASDTQGCVDEASCNANPGFNWDNDCSPEYSDCCSECSPTSNYGCQDPSSCEANDGKWCNSYCTSKENTDSICSPLECNQTGGMWKNGYCAECLPDRQSLDGCGEERCSNIPMANWQCSSYDDEDCHCLMCSIENGMHGNCNQEQCVPTAEAPDVTWADMYGSWRCLRCYYDGAYGMDYTGCLTEQTCNAVDGFMWRQDYGSCSACMAAHPYGCMDDTSCRAADGEWCVEDYDWGSSESCTSQGSCSGTTAPSPPSAPAPPSAPRRRRTGDSGGGGGGQCDSISVPLAAVAAARRMGFQPRTCP